MAKAKALRKTIMALRRMSKGKSSMPKASKAAAKAAKEMGKKAGLLRRMLPSIAGSYLGNKLAGGGGDDASAVNSQGPASKKAAGGAAAAAASLGDPTIQIPRVEGEELVPVAEETDLTLLDPVTAEVSIEPAPIVENYFDDKTDPIVSTAIIHEGTEINAISKSIGALAAATAAANALDASVKAATDENKRTRRANERRRDEADIEKKALGPGAVLGAGLTLGAAALGGFLSRFVMPAIALGFAQMANAFAEENKDNETPIGEIVEDNFGWLDDIEEKYTQVAIGLRSLGGNIKAGMASIVVNMVDKFGDWKAARIEKAMAMGPQQPGRIARLAEAIAQAKAWAPKPNTKAMTAFRAIQGFSNFIKSIISPITGAISKGLGVLAKLPGPIVAMFKGFMAKPVRWMAAFYALVAIKDAALAWALQMITEEEFHKRTKANLREFLQIIGGTWIICTIFALLGGGVGTLVVPFLGTLAGSALGVAIGVLFGESLWQIIGADQIVAALYDAIAGGKTFADAFKGIGGKIKKAAADEFTRIGEAFKDFFLDTGDMLGLVDRVATTEELAEEYGEDAELADIAVQAMDKGFFENEDENALYSVADSIRDQAHLEQVNAQMIEKTDMTLRQWAKSKLSPEEYEEFEGILMRSLSGRGGTGIDITDEMKTEYPVVKRDGTVVAMFDDRVSADQYIMKNQGSGVDTLYLGRPKRTYDPTLAANNEESAEGVQTETPELQYLEAQATDASIKLNEAIYSNSAKDIVNTAVHIRDVGYEAVNKDYEEMFGKTIEDHLTKAVGEEKAQAITRIMEADTKEEAIEIAAKEAVSYATENALPMLDTDLTEKMGDVAFIPFMMQGPRGPTEKGMTAGSEAPSLPSGSATPSYSTFDHFVNWGNVT